MSYLFDATGEYMSGTFNSSYTNAITLACWVKKTTAEWGTGQNCFIQLGESAARADGIQIGSNRTAADQVYAGTYNPSDSGFFALNTLDADYDDTWVVVVGVFSTTTTWNDNRISYINDSTDTNNNTGGATNGTTFDVLTVGNNSARGSLHANGLVAEVCVWDKALSTSEVDALSTGSGTGPAPNTIAAANVIGYWPLDADNATQANEGSDAGGDLSVTGATYNADHPTITASVATTILVPTGPWR